MFPPTTSIDTPVSLTTFPHSLTAIRLLSLLHVCLVHLCHLLKAEVMQTMVFPLFLSWPYLSLQSWQLGPLRTKWKAISISENLPYGDFKTPYVLLHRKFSNKDVPKILVDPFLFKT